MLRQIAIELKNHAPFTILGAISGVLIMVIIILAKVPTEISRLAFYTLHPLHVVLSALVTTAMYRKYGHHQIWKAILVGYTGSIGIATLSDAIMPHLGGIMLGVQMEFEVPFIETEAIPVIGIAKWQVVNSAALAGIIIGYLRPTTKIPHLGHVFLSTWASMFYFTAFGAPWLMPMLFFIFLFLFLSVWVPCCTSDIVFPLLLSGKGPADTHHEHH
jgi:hypothetical protein